MGTPVQAKDAMITCVTCGLTYSVSQGRDSCARCPLHEDCSTSCCPKCGTSNINPDKSRLARWLERILPPRQAPALRQAQGTGTPPAEPVEAPAAARWLPAGHSVSEPAEARNSTSKIRPLDFWGGREGAPLSTLAEAQQVPALRQAQGTKKQRTLADVPLGREVQVTGYGELNSGQRQHLQAYGLLPGRYVKVLSQNPVTIVQVEQTELAFERGVAARVLVGD